MYKYCGSLPYFNVFNIFNLTNFPITLIIIVAFFQSFPCPDRHKPEPEENEDNYPAPDIGLFYWGRTQVFYRILTSVNEGNALEYM